MKFKHQLKFIALKYYVYDFKNCACIYLFWINLLDIHSFILVIQSQTWLPLPLPDRHSVWLIVHWHEQYEYRFFFFFFFYKSENLIIETQLVNTK